MNTQTIYISKKENGKIQYLTEVLPEIPTNTILYKTLTGLGATYGELKANRNSIIIEPNVPVIVGKCKDPKHKDDNLFGVYEGVYAEDITKYLEASTDKRIKILTTPESFEEQRFQIIKIEPTFEYKLPITLIHTNNVLEYLKRTLSTLSTPICLFINSTDMIYSFIKQLDIETESTVFCAKKSVDKLKSNKFKNVFEHWSKDRMKKINFFTSRFYTALDIELDVKPTIVMITEVYFSEYSMIDPNTDAIQAIGRFRNGVDKIFHIFNTNNNFPKRTQEEINGYLQGCEEAYRKLKTLYNCASSEGARDSFRAALDIIPYNKMLDKEGKKNFFAIDNYKDEALLKSSYNNKDGVVSNYRGNKLFDVVFLSSNYPLGDFERLKRENKSISLKEKRKEIVNQLVLLVGDYETDMIRDYKRELRAADPFIVEAYEAVGKEVIESLKYSVKQIKEAMVLKRVREKTEGTEFIQLVKNSFLVGKKYTLKYIKEELTRIYQLIDLRPQKAVTGQSIRDFFEVRECKIGNTKALLLVEVLI